MILVKNKQRTIIINIPRIKNDIRIILELLHYKEFDVGILLVNLKTMQHYNKEYRNKNSPTDILSFPYHYITPEQRIVVNTEEDKNIGDIILCPSYISANLEQWDQSFNVRMRILLIHGILHLLGYDHVTDKEYQKMHTEEELLYNELNKIDPII